MELNVRRNDVDNTQLIFDLLYRAGRHNLTTFYTA